MRNKLFLVLSLFCVSTAFATDWPVYPEVTDGMTGPQQITNALLQLSANDTILVEPGTYDFTGISMRTDEYEKDSKTYVITNHLQRNIDYKIVGHTDGHWNDAIVFKGNGRCIDSSSWQGVGVTSKVTVHNITFEGFSCNDYPSGGSLQSRGGAMRLTDFRLDDDILSNCVIRGCYASIGGAVNGGALYDCFVTNNYAVVNGGVGCNTYVNKCRLVDNRTGGSYGCLYGTFGAIDSDFIGNSAGRSGGALQTVGSYLVTNCLFRGNTASDQGGAICVSGKKNSPTIVDCRFEDNRCGSYGGAITVYPTDGSLPIIRLCSFVGNEAQLNGGAIILFNGSINFPHVEDCRFVGNRTTKGHGAAIWVGDYIPPFPIAGCTFVSNRIDRTGAYGGAVYRGTYTNCVFAYNVVSNGYGGAAYFNSSWGSSAQNCSFVGNVSWDGKAGAVFCEGACPFTDCAFTNNYAWGDGGALYRGICTNCTFVGNRCVCYSGASIWSDTASDNPYLFNSKAVNCLFMNNYRRDNTGRDSGQHTEFQGGDVVGTRMENCEVIDGAGSFWRCSMVNCRIHDSTNTLGHCVFGEESWVTNCLVDHCRMDLVNASLFYRSHCTPSTSTRGRYRGEWVNCTFADNTLHNTCGMFSENWYDEDQGPKMMVDLKNCIFYNNRKADDTLADISGRTDSAYDVTYSNCVYGASDGTLKLNGVDGWTDVGGTFVCEKPGFVALQGARHGIAYYTPRATSKVVGKGDATMFAEGDVDLAGNPRLTKDGKLDLGCYTHTDRNFGCSFLVK